MKINLEEWKKRKKELHLTFDDLAKITQISRRTICSLFANQTDNPRIDTVEAIETALGLNKKSPPILSEEEKELITLISELTDEETQELTSFVDYLISKRK
jgi:predicted transcriptional regulator